MIRADTGAVLFNQGKDTQHVPWSVTKIMTLYVALQNVTGAETVTVPSQFAGTAGTTANLVTGEQISMLDLICAMWFPSGNDAARTLAGFVGGTYLGGANLNTGGMSTFVTAMNSAATSLGMTNTTYLNPDGQDVAGHTSTCNDIALVLKALMALSGTFVSTVKTLLVTQTRTCVTSVTTHIYTPTAGAAGLARIAGTTACKGGAGSGTSTGSTVQTYSMAIAATRGTGPLLIATTIEETTDTRLADVEKMLDYAWDQLSIQNAATAKVDCAGPYASLGTGWALSSLSASYDEDYVAQCSTTGAGLSAPMRGTVYALYAPKGPALGIMDVYVDGIFDSSVDLYAASGTATAQVWTKTYSRVRTRTVGLNCTGTKNASSSAVTVQADYFTHTDNLEASGAGPYEWDYYNFDALSSAGVNLAIADTSWVNVTGGGGGNVVTLASPGNNVQGRASNLSSVGVVHNVALSGADYSVSVDMKHITSVTGTSIGVIGRSLTAATTWYNFRYLQGTGLQLFRTVSGTATQLGSTVAFTPTAGQVYRLRLEMIGTTITGYVDEVQKVTATDANITATGLAGLRLAATTAVTNTTGAHVDNFRVESASTGNTVSVPAGSLTLTGLTPTVTATANNSVAVPAGSLALTAFAPTVTVGGNQSVAVPAGALALTGFAPTVNAGANNSIAVPAGSLSLSGQVPTVAVSNNQSVAVPVGSLGLTGLAPTVTATQANNIQVPAGTLALTGYAPTVLGGIVVQTGTGGGVREGRGYFSFQRAKRREEDEAQVEAALESLPAPKAAAVKAVLAEDHTDVLAAIEREVVLTRKQRAQVREVAQLVTRLAEQEREQQAREQDEQDEQAEIQAEAQRQHQMAVAAEQQRVFRRRRHAALLLLLH